MGLESTIWRDPSAHLAAMRPTTPVFYFSPETLAATARDFCAGFPGLVTYAVKANPEPAVLDTLAAAGLTAFDIASLDEAARVRAAAPEAALHYNNPVRSRDEVAEAVALGVRSFSVDSWSELAKLAELAPASDTEASVRFRLDVPGAAYDFGSKFGVLPDRAVELLVAVARIGFRASLTFHPGTQCTDPAAWTAYIRAAAGIAAEAGVTIARLNVGGGFPSRRGTAPVTLAPFFRAISQTVEDAFAGSPPALLCEPGRAMVAEAFSLGVPVRAVRDNADVFLADGIYGALSEWRDIGGSDRVCALAPDGRIRQGGLLPRRVFGPTCDSLDRLPGDVPLPADLAEGDILLFEGQGAYAATLATRFNGFGEIAVATVRQSGPGALDSTARQAKVAPDA